MFHCATPHTQHHTHAPSCFRTDAISVTLPLQHGRDSFHPCAHNLPFLPRPTTDGRARSSPASLMPVGNEVHKSTPAAVAAKSADNQSNFLTCPRVRYCCRAPFSPHCSMFLTFPQRHCTSHALVSFESHRWKPLPHKPQQVPYKSSKDQHCTTHLIECLAFSLGVTREPA